MKRILVFLLVALMAALFFCPAFGAVAIAEATDVPDNPTVPTVPVTVIPEDVPTPPPETGIDLTPIFQAVIALLATIVTSKVIPWIKARTTAQQRATLTAVAHTLVYAAEQLYGAGHGEQKLDYVIAGMRKRGYTADRAEIEAAVRGLGAAIVGDE